MNLKVKMREIKLVLLSIVIGAIFHFSHGCEIVDHGLWMIPIQADILDIHEGIVISRNTTGIEGINGISYGEATLAGPYFNISIENSQLIVRTNEVFRSYEEVEVASRVAITVEFNCVGGTTRGGLLLWIDVVDTNNNSPTFLPRSEYEFVITPPLPPGYLVTGCYNDPIIARDIDLTTQRIDFSIEENPYFEIEYDAESSTIAKQFNAHLRTKTFLRSLSEPLVLRITATDVDLTSGPPLSTTGIVRIVADAEFQFPEEPVFSQTFYLANYTADHQLNLLETISLRQGFDEYVNFTLQGVYAEHFNLIENGNQVSLTVANPLPDEVLSERQILLIVEAEREYTSGSSATVIVQFPEEIGLQFESAIYEGSIVNNSLQTPPLVLSQGYEGVAVSAEVIGEYSTYFAATVQQNLVTLTMAPLPDDIIDINSFISLQIVATSGRSSASTVLNLDIIKDDNVTPVFDQTIYRGSYNPATGLSVEQIVFVQGFDDTVSVELVGEYANLFEIVGNGTIITISSSIIPPEMYSQQRILLSVEASKPRTVGANAAIYISLPAARELEFEESTYRGTIEGDIIALQTILLTQGYEDDVVFNISGEYSTYFTTTNAQGQVTVVLSNPLPDTVITQNNVIILTLTASGINAVTTSTNILLDIIKYDTTTPVFSRPIYYGMYSGAAIEIEAINLVQGFDENILFRLDGAHAEYFRVEPVGNNAVVSLQSSIPEDVIFSEKVLLFNVIADKALTVGANAAVLIRFPTELTDLSIMKFSQNNYVGTLEENEIRLENIILETGFATGTEFILSGDYANHFYLSNTSSGNILQLSSQNTLPDEILLNNTIIVLEIEARRPRAVSVWTSVILDIVKEKVIAPVFGQAFYTGAYTEETGLTFEEVINLSEGYDETVTFALSEEAGDWFSLEQNGNLVSLVLINLVPADVIEKNSHLLFTIIASKPSNVSGRAVVSIDLPTDDSARLIRFQQHFYKGYFENSDVRLDEMILEGYTSEINYTLIGDYAENFELKNQNGTLTMYMETLLPNEVLEEITTFVFTLEVHSALGSTRTIIILENLKTIQENQYIEFVQPYYMGTFSALTSLRFDTEIKLVNEQINATFDLEGENAQWFSLVSNDSSVTLMVISPIPAAVLVNNQQLVFVVTAQSPGSNTARATVVISLIDSIPEVPVILGFDHVTYVGSIENNQTNIPAITLSQGYTQDVQFILHGELSGYFSLMSEGAVVTIVLQNGIPQQSIPANRIIVLEIQASAPKAVTAYATLVLEYVTEDAVSPAMELIFAQTFYSGSYAATTGLSFPTTISLAQGYDPNVVFDLEGDNSQWFGLERNENSVTVTLINPIPAAVLVNNQQLVFVVTAQSPGSNTARATVVISLIDSIPEVPVILGFDHVTYVGSIENNQTNIPAITLSQGYTQDVQFILHGELSDYFSLMSEGAVVTIVLQNGIPQQSIPANRIIVLEIQASAPEAVTAYATLVLEYVTEDAVSPAMELIFAQTFYSGSYATTTGLSFPTTISLAQGYDSNVVFDLEGDNSQWFGLERNENSLTVTLINPIPAAVLVNNQQLVFVVTAQSPGSNTARATVVISLIGSISEVPVILGFDHVTYVGSIENNQTNIPAITLSQGYTQDVQFILHGELSDYFSLMSEGAVVRIVLQNGIPQQSIPANRIIVLEIQASAPEAVTAYATLVLEYVTEDAVSPAMELIFAQTFYNGSYATTTGLSFPTTISLAQGYDSNVVFDLEGDNSQWFGLERNENSLTVTLINPIPAAVLVNNQQLVFVVTAQSPGSNTARATVVISLIDSISEVPVILGFDHVTYVGSIENNQTNIPAITLSQGYTQDVQFILHGELSDYFSLMSEEAVVTIVLQNGIPQQSIPANKIIVLEIQASAPEAVTAYATLVLEYVTEDAVSPAMELIFAQTFYSGSYATTTGLSFPTTISLAQGYDSNVVFDLEGDNSQWFGLERNANSVTVTLISPIPAAVLVNNQQLVFVVTAQSPGSNTARATVIIALIDYTQPGSDVIFDKVLYEGVLQNGVFNHEAITLIGFSGSTVELRGEYSSQFQAVLSNGVVTVSVLGSLTIPDDVTHVALEIHAGTASAVLLISVSHTDGPGTVTVSFASPSYAFRVDSLHTGFVGQVHATANNGEDVTYSLQMNNAILQDRLSINSIGEINLSASIVRGFYTFEVVAITVDSQIQGTAVIHLSVEAAAVCGDEHVMTPLIVLDVDEEEPHYDLISATQYDNCHFTLANRWPLNHTWIYVDETGLHTTAIDREHDSIAFMPVSQVQVEVILRCEGDSTRIKRSLTSDILGPYDYGSNKWILTDTIPFDSRRSFVNIIVNDINDNAPIFVGKENEPIVVGYPVPELAERVLPRSLVELEATDADIGENAALSYWSPAQELAVASTTGFVHLRDGATLENGSRLTVCATDRSGQGLTGSIDILVRLLDESYIAVVTVRDAFLDDEQNVISSLSDAVGYEIKVLRSVVISGEVEASRQKRDITSSRGASLQMYVYGLIATEPVSVQQLTTDISNIVTAPVIIASTVSLQDHLEGQEICVIAERDTGLLVATIVLSVLLFIVLALIAVWFFLRWRKNRNYDEFSDENSLASRNASDVGISKPDVMPRVDVAKLKESERRLQEMLDAPVEEVFVQPMSTNNDAVLNLPDPTAPIVIQSIDKLKAADSSDDEFGEVKTPKRKSVVTFNENVEKIIHLEDTPDADDLNSEPEYEVYKL